MFCLFFCFLSLLSSHPRLSMFKMMSIKKMCGGETDGLTSYCL